VYQLSDVRPTNRLREAYGDDIILFDEREESVVYRILSEFMLGENHYAVVEKGAPGHDDEPEIYRVTGDSSGELELETIEDDDEWETVSELYDEMTFPNDGTL